MKVIAFESILATPHTETLLELSVLHSLAGDEVIYVPAYRFVGSSPWNSPINGDPSLPRSITEWDRYIVNLLDPFVTFWVPDYVYQQFPQEWFEGSILDTYIGLATRTLYGSINSIEVSANIIAPRIAEVSTQVKMSIHLMQVIVAKLKPDRVYCFNGRTPSSWPLSRIAEKLKLDCRFHERGASIEKYALFRKPPAYNSAWRELFQSHRARRDLTSSKLNAAYFFESQATGKLKNFGYTNRDFNESWPNFLPTDEPFVVYFGSTDAEIDTVPDQDVYFPTLPSQFACVSLLKTVCKKLGIKLVIRLHPSTPFQLDEYVSLDDGISCFVIPPRSQISSYYLGSKALARFSVGSTIGFELAYRGYDCALMAKSLVTGEVGLSTTISEDSILRYIQNGTNQSSVADYVHFFGDFCLSYGEDYQVFRPTGQFSGVIDLTFLHKH